MTPRKIGLTALCGVALLLVAGAGAVLVIRTGSPATARMEQSVLALDWRAGHVQRYDILVDSKVALTTAKSSGPEVLVQRLEGELGFHTLESGPEGALVGMRLHPVELRIGGLSDAATNASLATPFRVRFGRDGLPASFEFPAALGLQTRALIEELVRTFQVCVREEANWQAEEVHATGAYTAQYRRTAAAQVQKQKLQYLAAAASHVPLAGTRVIASSCSIRTDPDVDWISVATIDETLTTSQHPGVTVEVTTHATLESRPLASPAPVPASRLFAFDATADASALVEHARRTNPQESLDPAVLAAHLREGLTALDLAAEGRMTLVHKLRDLLIEHEESALVLLDMMGSAELKDRTRADLFLVLEQAGTPAAQQALCRAFTEPTFAQRDSARAIIALGGVADPKPESLRALWSISRARAAGESDFLASTAALAIGAVGNRLHTAKDARYAGVRQDLQSAAWYARDARSRSVAVIALGNTRDASLALEVFPFFDDADPGVRRATALALGKLGMDDVGTEMLQRLHAEPSSQVRAAMAASLSSWKSPPTEAMESVRASLPNEDDDATRLGLVRFLGRDLERFPENEVALKELLRTERSDSIRKSIAESIAQAKRRSLSRTGG